MFLVNRTFALILCKINIIQLSLHIQFNCLKETRILLKLIHVELCGCNATHISNKLSNINEKQTKNRCAQSRSFSCKLLGG